MPGVPLKHTCLFFLSILFFFVPAAAKENNILLISSYNSSFPSFSKQVEGIKSVLHSINTSIDIEQMDYKRFPTQENTNLFLERISYKLKHYPRYDVVMASDDNAFEFALRHQHDLFDNIPIVFLGVNDIHRALEQDKNAQVTGIVEKISMNETVRLIKRLYPHASKIIGITDGTIAGRTDAATFTASMSVNKTPYEIIDISKISFSQLSHTLALIPRDTPVILIAAYTDCQGNTMNFYSSLNLITKSLKSPIFHLWEHGLDDGIVGGMVISHFEQGRMAASIVNRILNGEKIDTMRVVVHSPNKYMFDYNLLEKYNIDSSLLPDDSIIINRPENVFKKYHNEILVISFIFLSLLVIIVAFIVVRTHDKNTNKTLLTNLNTISALNKELVIARDEAQKSNSIKTAFIKNMSHEIRTPLNSIIGFADAITLKDISDEGKLEYGKVIKASSHQLLRIIDNLIEISTLETKNTVAVITKVCINETLDKIRNEFIDVATGKGLELSLSCPLSDMDSIIKTDEKRLVRIIVHLLENSIKYTTHGSVSFGYRISQDERSVIFFVKDTGCGISKVKQEHLFKIFSNSDSISDVRNDGLGLGLAIARRNADLLSGNISFESGTDGCSSFYLTIPFDSYPHK